MFLLAATSRVACVSFLCCRSMNSRIEDQRVLSLSHAWFCCRHFTPSGGITLRWACLLFRTGGFSCLEATAATSLKAETHRHTRQFTLVPAPSVRPLCRSRPNVDIEEISLLGHRLTSLVTLCPSSGREFFRYVQNHDVDSLNAPPVGAGRVSQ